MERKTSPIKRFFKKRDQKQILLILTIIGLLTVITKIIIPKLENKKEIKTETFNLDKELPLDFINTLPEEIQQDIQKKIDSIRNVNQL